MSSTRSARQNIVHVEPGEVIVEENTLGRGLFVLMRGKLEVLRHGVRVATLSQKGSFVGEISSILGCPCSATVRAIEPSDLLHVENVTEYFEKNPQVAHVVAQTLARRLMDMNNRFVALERLLRRISGEHALAPELSTSVAQALAGVHEIAWDGVIPAATDPTPN